MHCRAVKPMRDLEAIMQEEQELAGVHTDPLTPAAQEQPAEPMDDLVEQIQDTSGVNSSSDSMELASTSEVLDMFAEYYEADRADASKTIVDNDRVDSSLDFKDKALDSTKVVHSVTAARASTMGNSTEVFDINTLL